MLPNLTVWEFFIMQKIVPAKLQKGDEVRIIAPATGLKIIGQDCREIAKERFEAMGLKVSFATNTTDENLLYENVSVYEFVESGLPPFEDMGLTNIVIETIYEPLYQVEITPVEIQNATDSFTQVVNSNAETTTRLNQFQSSIKPFAYFEDYAWYKNYFYSS